MPNVQTNLWYTLYFSPIILLTLLRCLFNLKLTAFFDINFEQKNDNANVQKISTSIANQSCVVVKMLASQTNEPSLIPFSFAQFFFFE